MKRLLWVGICLWVSGCGGTPVESMPDPDLQPRFSSPGVWALEKSATSEIRVLVFPHPTSNAPQGRDTVFNRTALSSSGTCTVTDAKSGRRERTGSRLDFTAAGLKHAVRVDCDQPATIERAGGAIQYTYRGRFLIRKGSVAGAASVEIINLLTLEEYLRGVVPIEMPKDWPSEALRAQAIAARTYAMFHVSLARANFPRRGWDVDDTVQYQAYTGTRDQASTTDAAIASTTGQHLEFDGKVIQAFFSADAGGHTEDAENVWPVWGKVPYCRARREDFDRGVLDSLRWGPWTVELTWADLARKLSLSGALLALEVRDAERTASGRVSRVHARTKLTSGVETDVAMSANDVRRLLKLRSTLFSVTTSSVGATFRGLGFGHGVGMSQVGAKAMADSLGRTAEQILDAYYTDVRISVR